MPGPADIIDLPTGGHFSKLKRNIHIAYSLVEVKTSHFYVVLDTCNSHASLLVLRTWYRGSEHVRVGVDELVDELLLPHAWGADEDERLAGEGRHLLHGLVQHHLRLVEVQILSHVILVLSFFSATLEGGGGGGDKRKIMYVCMYVCIEVALRGDAHGVGHSNWAKGRDPLGSWVQYPNPAVQFSLVWSPGKLLGDVKIGNGAYLGSRSHFFPI